MIPEPSAASKAADERAFEEARQQTLQDFADRQRESAAFMDEGSPGDVRAGDQRH